MIGASGYGGAAALDSPLLMPNPAPRWADYVQQGNWAEIGIKDRERAAAMSEKEIINWVISCREESATARRPLEPYWAYWEDLYNLRTWDREKQEWQSQILIPEVRTKIRVALSMIQSGLLDAPEFFKAVNLGLPYDDEAVRFIQRLIDIVQSDAGFIEAALGSLEQALLLGTGCMGLSIEEYIDRRPHVQDPSQQEMMQWQYAAQMAAYQGQMPPPQPQPFVEAMPDKRSRFAWKMKDIWWMYPDPRAEDPKCLKYVVEESEVDEDDIHERWAAGIYDDVSDIGRPAGARQSKYSHQRRFEISDSQRTARTRHCIQEFTGNIYDGDGHCVAENWIVTVANEKSILRIGPNPLWRAKSRYKWCIPLPYRGRVWGRSLIDADAHIQVAYQNYLNLILDSAKYETLKAFVWNSSKSDEPNAPQTIEPGRVYKGTDPSVLTPLQLGGANINGLWPALNAMLDWGGKSTQIGEWADGTPTSRGRPSAAEVKTKTGAGAAYVHNMVRNLEREFLEPALDLTYEAVVQFGSDESEPRMNALLQEYGGPQWFADPIQRLRLLDKNFKIKVGGISLIMSRETLIERMMQFIQTMGMMGMMIPPETMAQLPYIVLSGLGLSPEQISYPTSPQAYQQMLMQIQMQQAAQMGGGGPGGGPGALTRTTSAGAAPLPPGPPPPEQMMPPMGA